MLALVQEDSEADGSSVLGESTCRKQSCGNVAVTSPVVSPRALCTHIHTHTRVSASVQCGRDQPSVAHGPPDGRAVTTCPGGFATTRWFRYYTSGSRLHVGFATTHRFRDYTSVYPILTSTVLWTCAVRTIQGYPVPARYMPRLRLRLIAEAEARKRSRVTTTSPSFRAAARRR